MATVTAGMVKELREKTGAGMPNTSQAMSAFGSVRESGAFPCTTVMPSSFA